MSVGAKLDSYHLLHLAGVLFFILQMMERQWRILLVFRMSEFGSDFCFRK